MKRFAWLVGALMSLALLCPAVLIADDGADKPKKARKKRDKKPGGDKKSSLRGEYAIMAKELSLDADQQAKLKAAVAKAEQARKEWQASPSGQKSKELSEARKQAAKDKDKDKLKAIGAEMKELQKQQAEIEDARRAEILAILTPEQKTQWAGFTLKRGVMGRYKRCELSDTQQASLSELCNTAAKDMPDRSDKKAYGAAMKKLGADIEEKILTPAQREQLQKKPEGKPREPKAKKGGGKGGKKKGGAGIE